MCYYTQLPHWINIIRPIANIINNKIFQWCNISRPQAFQNNISIAIPTHAPTHSSNTHIVQLHNSKATGWKLNQNLNTPKPLSSKPNVCSTNKATLCVCWSVCVWLWYTFTSFKCKICEVLVHSLWSLYYWWFYPTGDPRAVQVSWWGQNPTTFVTATQVIVHHSTNLMLIWKSFKQSTFNKRIVVSGKNFKTTLLSTISGLYNL